MRKLKVKTYEVVSRAVEEGVSFGWQRFMKYHDGDVSEMQDAVYDNVVREVLNALCEVVDFED